MTFSKTLSPDTCRFYPSCSHYGYQAVYKYGIFKGGSRQSGGCCVVIRLIPGLRPRSVGEVLLQNKKYLFLIGLLLPLALVLSGCAAGLTANAWPAMTTDYQECLPGRGPYVYAVSLQTHAQVWRFPASSSAANPFYATPVLTPDGQLIVGGFDKKLYSINPVTGQSTWQFTGAMTAFLAALWRSII